MPGSAEYDPGDVLLAGFATPVGVYRYTPEAPSGSRYTLLPNVVCDQGGQYREGAEPAAARFRYLFDDSDPDTPFPKSFSEAWPLTASGPYVVQPDDRIVVRAFTSSGSSRVLFDGFAQIPQVEIGQDGHSVTFTAVDVSIRLWDTPIASARYRDADDPDAGDVVVTDLDVRFNPDKDAGEPIQPNCTPDDHDVPEEAGPPIVGDHPVFLDSRIRRDPDPRTYWTLGKIVRYLLARHNDQAYVENPDFAVMDELLNCYASNNGEGFYDPDDPSTYTSRPIVVRDYDATNKFLPDVLEELLGYNGFAFRFACEEDAAGEPWHTIEIYRKDASGAGSPLDLRLQEVGAVLDMGHSNVAELRAVRDTQSIANEFVVATDPILYEVSVVLAPGFAIDVADATDANVKNFLKAAIKAGDGANRWKYRRYVADEAGDGHWNFATADTVTTSLDLATLFASLDPDETGAPTYVRRLRPGRDTLLTTDAENKPLKAQLALSRDYAGDVPGVWDGMGTWRTITQGWELLKDRLGILVTAENPDAWNIGKSDATQHAGEVLRSVKAMADPDATKVNLLDRFFLRLTCVIEGDFMLTAEAPRRLASPTRFRVRRRVDARDHFRKQVVAELSLHNPDVELVVRDDEARATAHAEALRAAHEFAPLAGSVTIPWLSFAYEVGMKIDVIDGRGVSLRTNVGAEAGEAPQYPTVVAKSWDFSGGQQRTVLHLSDRRAEPQRA